ncbi:16443_t:CDS:2, partial [Funneliformis geosporum]
GHWSRLCPTKTPIVEQRTALSQFTPMTPFNMETTTHFPLPPPIHAIPITCCEKPSFNQYQQLTPVHTPIDDEYEEEELIPRRNYVILGDQDTQPILAEQEDDQTI